MRTEILRGVNGQFLVHDKDAKRHYSLADGVSLMAMTIFQDAIEALAESTDTEKKQEYEKRLEREVPILNSLSNALKAINAST